MKTISVFHPLAALIQSLAGKNSENQRQSCRHDGYDEPVMREMIAKTVKEIMENQKTSV